MVVGNLVTDSLRSNSKADVEIISWSMIMMEVMMPDPSPVPVFF